MPRNRIAHGGNARELHDLVIPSPPEVIAGTLRKQEDTARPQTGEICGPAGALPEMFHCIAKVHFLRSSSHALLHCKPVPFLKTEFSMPFLTLVEAKMRTTGAYSALARQLAKSTGVPGFLTFTNVESGVLVLSMRSSTF
jgi:hypothetical protein